MFTIEEQVDGEWQPVTGAPIFTSLEAAQSALPNYAEAYGVALTDLRVVVRVVA